MRTHLQFSSDAFQPTAGEDSATNPGIFGARLASFLADQFVAAGYLEADVVCAEDWGWMVKLEKRDFHVWLGCASYDTPPEWLVFIEPSKPRVRAGIFKHVDTTAVVEKVADQLETVLKDAGSATKLIWWSDHDSGRK